MPSGDDQIAGVRVTAGGSGYTSAPAVAFTGGGGKGAAGVGVLDSDAVSSIRITDPGSGYSSVPTAAFTGGGGSGAAGTAILSIAGTEDMAEKVVRGMIDGGVWVQAHTGAPGTNGTANPLTDIPRIELPESGFTVETV